MVSYNLNHIILHVPHASLYIPADVKSQFLLSERDLGAEILAITDRYVDELFAVPGTAMIKSPVSRLVVDMERFRSDEDEVMAAVGMGAVYERTSDGQKLRDITPAVRAALLERYYDPYHREFESAVAAWLDREGRCLIIDCHSFPSRPLPYELDQDPDRPEICLGTCDFHTPERLRDYTRDWMAKHFSVAMNRPFAGTFVPSRFYRRDERVSSIMIEVNRSLYMDEANRKKNDDFDRTKGLMQEFIRGI